MSAFSDYLENSILDFILAPSSPLMYGWLVTAAEGDLTGTAKASLTAFVEDSNATEGSGQVHTVSAATASPTAVYNDSVTLSASARIEYGISAYTPTTGNI